MTTYHDYIDEYAEEVNQISNCEVDTTPNEVVSVWCDGCDDWVSEVTLCGGDIVCICGNTVLKRMAPKDQKQTRQQIARAIWNL